MSTPSAFQEKGCWKMRWPRSPAKNRALRPAAAQRGQEAQLSDAQVLRLVHDGEIERRSSTLDDSDSASAREHLRPW